MQLSVPYLQTYLQYSNEEYPTNSAFRKKLDDLYGSVLYVDSSKKGNKHILSLNAETVNDVFYPMKK